MSIRYLKRYDNALTKRSNLYIVMALLIVVLSALPAVPARAQESGEPQPTIAPFESSSTNTPSWLEPRALNVLDLVGQVPEEHLRNSVIIFGQAGVTRYLRGERVGDKVTVEVSISTWAVDHNGLIRTDITCLGRRPIFDEWLVPVPQSTMRVFSNGKDVTDQVLSRFLYTPAAQAVPLRGSGGKDALERYHMERLAPTNRTPDGALIIPPNMGCQIWLPGIVPNLTAEFEFDYPQQIQVETLGSETFEFHSYIGVGHAGAIDSLRNQLLERFGNRHEKFPLHIPEGADYVWLNYPPTPVSLYSTVLIDRNIDLPFGGTYRFIGPELSTDHVVSMGLPLHVQWRDSDLTGGSWLERLGPSTMISSPEYFVPPGVAYDPCMRFGGCSDELLDRIYNTEAEMTLYYYRVRRLTSSNLFRVPLYAVGRDWSPGDTPFSAASTAPEPTAASGKIPPRSVHLPMVTLIPPPPLPSTYPDDAPQAGCPCGWFDENFRMLDVIPGLQP